MPLQAFFLVMLAGLIHALWNIAAKKANGDASFIWISNVMLVIFWAPIGVYVGWDVVLTWNLKEWSFIAVSGGLHSLYFVVLLRGYRKSDLTVVYPLARGFGPLISSFVALFFWGEQISTLGLLGIFAVVSGVFLIAGGTNLWRSVEVQRDTTAKQKRINQGITYGLLTGLFIAGYTLLDGYAVKVVPLPPVLLTYFAYFFQILFLLPTQFSVSRLSRSQWQYAFLIAVISPISYVLVLYAMQSSPLSQVAPAREVSMLFAALLGGHLLKEGDRIQRLLGALCIAAGVIALGQA